MGASVLTSELRYALRPENIACEPPDIRLGSRDLGRMLVVNRRAASLSHGLVFSLADYLSAGDVFVLNDSKRVPGVLFGRTSNGAQVELRFASLDDSAGGTCQIYPDHFAEVGTQILLSGGEQLTVTAKCVGGYQLWRVDSTTGSIRDVLKHAGHPITSFFSRGYWELENYNNFYAAKEGSVESPMAGIHLTPRLLTKLQEKGVIIAFITLHSNGSWIPITEERIEDHRMREEAFELPSATAAAVLAAKASGKRIVACGSTVVRTLETAVRRTEVLAGCAGATDLYITPGYDFRVVDAYFTNFHTSSSSLMVLDAAFCPLPLLKVAYAEASAKGYLFHEFGDAVFYH